MMFGILEAKHWPSSDLMDSLSWILWASAFHLDMESNTFGVRRSWRISDQRQTLSWKEGLNAQLGKSPASQRL
jgi:hypothetical protein